MRIPADWRGIGKLIYAFRERYEAELLPLIAQLRPGAVFADVGASIGLYTLLGARGVGDSGRVLSFEPASRTFRYLRTNVELNGLKNVRLWRAALADKQGIAWLSHHPDSSRNSIAPGADSPFPGERVRLMTFDSALRQEKIERLDVLKIDAEGADPLILRGARGAIEKFRPVAQFEVNRAASQALGVSYKDAWNTLAAYNYKFYTVTYSGKFKELSAPRDGNILAIPE